MLIETTMRQKGRCEENENTIFCGEERSDKIEIGRKKKKDETASLLTPPLSIET
jgi:hypothetical protein